LVFFDNTFVHMASHVEGVRWLEAERLTCKIKRF
jgi:hypothetical protein